jgi:hypothetical protein
MKLAWSLLTLSSLARSVHAENYYRNVLGDQLQPCSSDGMALTGYTRNGKLMLDGCSLFLLSSQKDTDTVPCHLSIIIRILCGQK